MFMTKLKTVALTLLVATLLVVAGLFAFRAPAADPPRPPADPPAAEAERPRPAPAAKERVTLKGHGGMVWAVAFSPDGKTLATVSGLYNKPGELILDAVAGKEKARATSLGIRSGGPTRRQALATADYYDNNVRLHTLDRQGARRPGTGIPNNAVAFPTARRWRSGCSRPRR
jgi:hypothetical protein